MALSEALLSSSTAEAPLGSSRKSSMPCTVPCCSRCCLPLSCTGIVFCLIIGSLFKRQPFIIDGDEGVHDGSDKADACFGAAGIYCVTLALSIFGLLSDRRKEALARRAGFGWGGGGGGGMASSLRGGGGGSLGGSADALYVEMNESRQLTVPESLKAELDDL